METAQRYPSAWLHKPVKIKPIDYPVWRTYIVSIHNLKLREYVSYGPRSGRSKKEARKLAKQRILQIFQENDQIRKNDYRYITQDVIEVKLTREKTMLIDVEDLHHILEHSWCAHNLNGIWYADSHATSYHRLITDYQKVDHIGK